MGILSSYKPSEVLRYFEEICSYPHGSGNIDKLSDYLVRFASERNLRYRQDEAKNVIIWKGGTPGYENSAPVIIQGHMDMVAVRNEDCDINLETEGLRLEVIEADGEEWISAKGTSLGGDDGIAVAYALALLDSDNIPHPPLEVIITTDEEIGMLGAAAIDVSDIKGRIFMNADSEEEGIFTVSCAGGVRATSTISCEPEHRDGTVMSLKLSGFRGGHSGVEIDKGRLNANIVLGRVLREICSTSPFSLISISGGEMDNAIATFSEAAILVEEEKSAAVKDKAEEIFATIREEYSTIEESLRMDIRSEKAEKASCFTAASSKNVINLLVSYPNGIIRMNPDMPGMVQTSLNLGIMRTSGSEVILTSALRSSSETEKMSLLQRVRSVVELAGGTTEIRGNYPGWEYRPDSLLRDTMVAAYREQYGTEPIIQGVHAGLECGLFSEKLGGLDCISFGPQMRNIHTTGELLSIPSVERTWKLTKSTLARLK